MEHRFTDALEHLSAREAKLVLHVEVGGRNESMDPTASRAGDRARTYIDVARVRSRQPADHGTIAGPDLRCDSHDGIDLTARCGRKACLDHIHSETRELTRDVELLRRRHRAAGCLLAIAERRIEDSNPISGLRHHGHPSAWGSAGGYGSSTLPGGSRKESPKIGFVLTAYASHGRDNLERGVVMASCTVGV